MQSSVEDPPAAPARRARRLSATTTLLAGGLVLALAVVSAATLAALSARQRALTEAGRELRNTSLLLADHTERVLQAVDLALDGVLERGRAGNALSGAEAFAAWAGRARLHQLLRDRAGILPQADALLLADAAGRLVASSRAWPAPPLEVTDRAWFQALRDGAATAVGGAVRNRATGSPAFHLARRIEGPDGAFLGAAVGVIEIGYFEGLYRALALGPESDVALLRADGALLARSRPGTEEGDGGPWPGERPALVSARVLGGFPLRVEVVVTEEGTLRPWRAILLRIAGGAALLLAAIAWAVAAGIRAARAEARAASTRLMLERGAAATRLRHEREMAAHSAGFREIVEGMSQGVCRFGPDGRLALANGRCAEVLGCVQGALRVGATLDELAEAAAAARADGVLGMVRRLSPLVQARLPGGFVQDLPGGRAVSVVHQPLPDGGWLATFEDVSERRAAEARARHLARHDPLTGLPNRAHLQEHLTAALLRAATAPRQHVAVLYMDLDRFKQVNDTLGHPAGDALLRAAADRIARRVRRHRRGERRGADLVARIGGDEFAVVLHLPGGEAEELRADAATVAARLVAALSRPFVIGGQQVVVGATVGVALHPEDGDTPEELLRLADLALCRAKAEGRGRHRFFERAMDAEVRERRALELDLRRALVEEGGRDFEIHFQPIVDIATRLPTGCEALVRWHRGGGAKLIGPSSFVPLAEETGLIGALGATVFRRACAEAAAWPDRSLLLAVNLSPAQFRAPGLVESVAAALSEAGLDPRRLELEITEGVLLQSTEEALATMHRLRELGVRFAMDDFGTGYSSLAYLRFFPFDRLKVDRAFVRHIEADPGDVSIVRAVAGMGRELGMTTVAEGVETEGQLRLLAEAGCRHAQGYLFSAPVPASELPAVLARLSARARSRVLV